MTTELFEVAIGGNEGGVLLQGDGRRDTVDIRDIVQSFQLACPEGLGKIDWNNLHRQSGKVGYGLTSFFLPNPLPSEIEHLADVQNRYIQLQLLTEGIRQQLFDLG